MEANEYLIGGYISVSSVISTGSREVIKLIFDKDRQSRISSASYHYPEKAQYKFLKKYITESNAEAEYISESEFKELTHGEAYGGIAAIVGKRRTVSVESLAEKGGFLILIDGIEDPFNFGYVLRTAYACGCNGVFLPERNYFTSSDIVIRSSAGASELLDVAYFSEPSQIGEILKNKHIRMYCTAKTDNSTELNETEFSMPLCVVIGGEKRGINKSLLSYADGIVSIGYKNQYTMSLSASSASAIIIYGVASRLK